LSVSTTRSKRSWPSYCCFTIQCRLLGLHLRLHLRLEERWLAAQKCLCSGHRSAHAQAAEAAMSSLLRTVNDRQARLSWLLELQSWFDNHRNGPDTTAYAIARSNAPDHS
jgi:hypothetical protein